MKTRRLVRLVASARFTYVGRMLSLGDKFEAPRGDAHMLVASGKASIEEEAKALEQEPIKSKRQYKRRDMVAEQ